MDFNKKVKAVRDSGEAKRSTWKPSGAVKRSYDYWLEHSDSLSAMRINSGRRKENFCHYWRVAMFWSPMLRLGKSLVKNSEKILGSLAALLAVGMLFGLYKIISGGLWAEALTALGIIFSFIVGIALGATLTVFAMLEGERLAKGHEPYIFAPGWMLTASSVALFPVFLASYGCYWLIERGIFLYTVPPIVFVGMQSVMFYNNWVLALQVNAALVTVAALALALFLLFAYSDKKHQEWLDYKWDYFEEHHEFPPVPEKKVGPVGRAWRNVASFVGLLFEVVRTKKWKICPWVEVDSQRS